jgi:hypothetical protein
MTLTLSPEIEKALTTAAARKGTTPEQIVTEMVQEKFVLLAETPEERKARVYALMGSMAHLGPSHIAEDRAEEIAREERRERK